MISFRLIVAISFDLIAPFVANGFPTFWKFKKFSCLLALLSSIEKHLDYLKPPDRLMALLLLLEDNMHRDLP